MKIKKHERIWHPYWLWECNKAGFYLSCDNKEQDKEKYREFLSDLKLFEKVLKKVILEWKYSCEHFLTDVGRNRIAWLGQASMVYAMQVPAEARGGFKLLSKEQQTAADAMALKYLKKWEREHKSKDKQIH